MEFVTVLLILGLPVAVALSAYIASCAADNLASAYRKYKGYQELVDDYSRQLLKLSQEQMKNVNLTGQISFLEQQLKYLEGKQ